MPRIAEALAVARELGLSVVGFESMCGIPLCLVPESVERFLALAGIEEDIDGGEFVRTDACTHCGLRDRCYGLRRGYADLHGTGELRAVSASVDV